MVLVLFNSSVKDFEKFQLERKNNLVLDNYLKFLEENSSFVLYIEKYDDIFTYFNEKGPTDVLFEKGLFNYSIFKALYFDDSYEVYLANSELGDVSIVYEKNIEDYCIHSKFYKTGDTELTIKSPDGDKRE